MTGAIYHFTDKSETRPIVCEKQLEALQEFAKSLDIEVLDVFLDKSLKKSEQAQFEAFMSVCERYDCLVTKDFHHIDKHTRAMMKVMKELRDKGLTIYSIENGVFDFTEAPLNKKLRVATYTMGDANIRNVKNSIQLQQDIYASFVRRKTEWSLIRQYADICLIQNDAAQESLMDLLEHKNEFDILLVNNLGDVNWRTARFCKLRSLLGKDIYSLQDGYLIYKEA